jgi:NADP-dependent 3-hydroxy acid dehydrogenase YdfG
VSTGGPVGIITGAASGIGAATALEFAGLGARLVLAGLPSDTFGPVVDAVRDAGGLAVTTAVDVRDEDQVAAMAALALDRFGRIDFLLANAGIADQSSVPGGDPARWRAVLDTNLLGAALCVRAVLPQMIAQGSGHVLLTASVSGREIYVGEPIYIASKWGLVGFGHALRKEVAPKGIRVTIVEPGLVDTPLTRGNPMVQPLLEAGMPLRPEDVARAIVFAHTQPAHVAVSELTLRPLEETELVFAPQPGG